MEARGRQRAAIRRESDPPIAGIAARTCLDWLKSKQRTQIPFSALGPNYNPESFVPSRPEMDGVALDREEELQQLLAARWKRFLRTTARSSFFTIMTM